MQLGDALAALCCARLGRALLGDSWQARGRSKTREECDGSND
jgi:hypothetical protein